MVQKSITETQVTMTMRDYTSLKLTEKHYKELAEAVKSDDVWRSEQKRQHQETLYDNRRLEGKLKDSRLETERKTAEISQLHNQLKVLTKQLSYRDNKEIDVIVKHLKHHIHVLEDHKLFED